MNIEPIYDRVIIERLDTEETSKGGIIIPGTAQEKNLEGIVVAHGAGSVNKDTGEIEIPISVKVGDRVLFPKHSGTDIQIEGKNYLVVCEPEILAVLEDE